ncbi:hypothetical protein [Streptomyces catenulae]|uniref:Secreted protein n=1 Tax=Streptomyces catenulae TaxID=66875 RepID=A0ABV2Z1K4_9ACTN|nr:hypothetical protein [Streptomyces catenulae]
MRAITVCLVAAAATLGSAVPASATEPASGEVVVFSTEAQPLDVYRDPEGCRQLPTLAHVLANRTDHPVKVYGNPFCVGPSVAVLPDHGIHVPGGAGSFSA